MPFFVSPVDPRVTPGHEIMLSPAPTVCQYPGTANGDRIETPDGRVVFQEPNNDPRARTWIWQNYPGFAVQYERQFVLLQTLRARTRVTAGLPPYIWVRDTATRKLRRQISQTLTVASSGSTATDLVLTGTATIVSEGVLEVLPGTLGGTGTGAYQIIQLAAMTSSTVTVQGQLETVPHGAKIRITGYADDWFKVRVLDVNRTLREDGGNVRYTSTIFDFVVEDSFLGVGSVGQTLDRLTLSISAPTVQEDAAAPTLITGALDTQNQPMTGLTYSYESNAPSVATVNATTGAITLQGPGVVQLTVRSLGLSASVMLTVTSIPKVLTSIVLSGPSSVIATHTGSTYTAIGYDQFGSVLTVQPTFVFHSSATSKATIGSSSGVPTGVAAGTTSITATSGSVTSNAITLTITAQVATTVTITPSTVTTAPGATQAFFATVVDQIGGPMSSVGTWTCDHTSEASISSSGVLTLASSATTGDHITVTYSIGSVTGTATVTVGTAPESLVFSLTSITGTPGDSFALTVTLGGVDITDRCSITSDNTGVAVVE